MKIDLSTISARAAAAFTHLLHGVARRAKLSSSDRISRLSARIFPPAKTTVSGRPGPSQRARSTDDDKELHEAPDAVLAARQRERERCAAIFSSPDGQRNPALAKQLAFRSRETRADAIALLELTPAPLSLQKRHADRAARNPRIGADGSSQITSAQAVASSWDRALTQTAVKSR